MNSPGLSIIRAAGGGGQWNIADYLRVDNGSVGFGAATTPAIVGGDVYMGNNGSITLSSAAGGDISIGGNFTDLNTSGPWQPQQRTVTFDGVTTQTITLGSLGGSYENMPYMVVATPMLNCVRGNGISIYYTLTINAGATFAPDCQIFAGSDIVNNGTLAPSYSFQMYNYDGLLHTFTNNANFLPTGPNFDLQGFTDNDFLVVNNTGGNFNAAVGSTQFRIYGNTTFTGTNMYFGTLYINNSPANNILTGTNGTINIRDFFNAYGTYRGQSGTVVFNGSAFGSAFLFSTTGGDIQFHDINIPAGNALAMSLGSALLKVNGNISNLGAISDFSYADAVNFNGSTAITGGGSTQFGSVNISNTLTAPSNVMNVTGSFTNTNTFNANSGTVDMSGSGNSHLLTLNVPTTFNNLTVDTNALAIETVSAHNATVAGTLGNLGTIRKTQPISGPGTVDFGLTAVTTTVTTQGSMISTQVDRIDQNNPNAPPNIQTGRYWNITPSG